MKTRLFLTALLSLVSLFLFLGLVGGMTRALNTSPLAAIHSLNDKANAPYKSSNSTDTAVITFTPVATLYLPLVAKTYPWPVYRWLTQQQDAATGLVASQQDQFASTYNNALAIMAFTLKGDYAKAKRVLERFKASASEFFAGRCSEFDLACSTTDPCDGTHPCGFFQSRNSTTGAFDANSDRWIGDMSWLLMAAQYYRDTTGDISYDSMITATLRLLKDFQQPQGYIATGWIHGDQVYTTTSHPEGNLDAYKALLLFGEDQAAQQVKDWLDFHDFFPEYNKRIWKEGPLDLHTWRLSLGDEYGFSLPDIMRSDDTTILYSRTINYNNSLVTGFTPDPYYCQSENNIWSEGTGQAAVSFYKAGYQEQGDFYVSQLERLLFEPHNYTGTQALSLFALPTHCNPGADPAKGHVASTSWYIFAKEHFDPFDGVVMDSFHTVNPVVRLEAENYDNSSGSGLRRMAQACFPKDAAYISAVMTDFAGNNPAAVEYKFNVLLGWSPITVSIRYADDVAGDNGKLLLDGSLLASFNTVDTGTWNNYTITDFPLSTLQLQPGLHTLRLEVTDNGTYGLTVDYFQMAISASVSRHAGAK